MNAAYKRRIAASKARLDDEMRGYARALRAIPSNSPSERLAAMRLRFPAINPDYARELTR